MSFADEFKKMRSNAGAPKSDEVPESSNEAAAASAPASNDPDAEIYKSAYGDAAKTFGQAAVEASGDEAPEAEAPKAPPAPSEGRKVEIKIGGKVFTSEKEAFDYANELELIRLQEEAVRAHVEASKPKEEPKLEPKKIKAIADELFENPEAALEKLQALIEETAESKISAREKAQIEAQAREADTRKFWDNFYKSNSDLVGFDEEVNRILEKEWNTLQHMKQDEGLKQLALKTREYIDSMREKVLPKQVLSSKTAMAASASNASATATSKPATKESSDFISQIKKHNKRNVVQTDV